MQHHPSRTQSTRRAALAPTPGRRVRTILVADDSIFQRMMTRAMLEAEGYEVLEAANGREVLHLVHLARPGLILMDVAMPSMDGLTAARRIRSNADDVADIPIVFLTALGASDDRETALAAGGNDYVVKPFTRRELLRAVERYAKGADNAERTESATRQDS